MARPGDFYLDGEERLVAVVFVYNRYPFVALQCVPLNLVSGRELDDNLCKTFSGRICQGTNQRYSFVAMDANENLPC